MLKQVKSWTWPIQNIEDRITTFYWWNNERGVGDQEEPKQFAKAAKSSLEQSKAEGL